MVQKISGLNIEPRYLLSILAATASIVVLDFVLVPLFRNQNLNSFYSEAALSTIVVVDFIFALSAGLVGLLLVSRLGLPFWWSPRTDESRSIQIPSLVAIILGAVLVLWNLFTYINNFDQITPSYPFLTTFTSKTAVALALRAALNEEIFFRLFLFPAVAWVVMHFVRREASLIVGGVASSVCFGLIHPGFFLAFFMGLGIVYIYYYKGLLPAMIVHFLVDAVPFLYLAVAV